MTDRPDDDMLDRLLREDARRETRPVDDAAFEARFSTWLYRIAFNAWRSEARKKREVALEIDDDALPPNAEAAFDEMPDVAARVDLERALATLSDGERACVSACYYADLSHEEAAAALGLPLGTVKTHIMRAKAKLKVRLAAKEKLP